MSEVLAVYLEEALGHQSVLGDAKSSDEARLEAARAIQQAALLVGDGRAARAAGQLALLLADPVAGDGDTVAELEQRIAEALHDTATRGRASDADPPVSLSLDEDEMTALRAVFRDEASSVLEEAASQLGDSNSDPAIGLETIMRAAHSIKGSAATVALPQLAEVAHQFEDRLELARAHERDRGPWIDAVIECIDSLRAVVFASEDDSGVPFARMDSALLELDAVLVPGAKKPPAPRRKRASTMSAAEVDSVVLRIDGARVDALLEELGSLVLDQSRLERRVALLGHLAREISDVRTSFRDQLAPNANREALVLEQRLASATAELQSTVSGLAGDAEALARAGDHLRRGLTELRMQSASSLFERLAPHIRSAARDAGKRVQIIVDGGDTRFDKAVAEAIADPLTHLLRNAVAHGIEAPAVRAAAGKCLDGMVSLRAQQQADNFILEVADDGAGIDPEDIRQRLVESGRWSASRARLASNDEVLSAIFDAGVTSRRVADALAGRGVGLDAVRATVARLGGEIEVRSVPGAGTTFRLRLPLTTAVAQTTTLLLGDHQLAVPSAQIEKALTVTSDEVLANATANGMPLISGHELLGIPASGQSFECAVVTYAERRVGLVCDSVGDSAETVVKGLGPPLSQLPVCAGATISGAGRVTFIIDPVALVRQVYSDDELPAAANETSTTTVAAPARVLVTDDSRTTRQAIASQLGRAGYIVDVAEDGEKAWTLLRTLSYDALVTDIEMPGISGLDLAKRARDDDALADLTIVVVTSRPRPEYRERAESIGVTAVLQKPVADSALVAALRTIRD